MKFIFSLLLSLAGLTCYPQENSIEYAFSKEVTDKIEIYIKDELKKLPERIYYCVLSAMDDNYKIDVQFYSAGDQGHFVKTINRSNRYVLIGCLKVPIVFEFDLKFVSYGVDEKGRHLRSHLIFENPRQIKFNNKGKVID